MLNRSTIASTETKLGTNKAAILQPLSPVSQKRIHFSRRQIPNFAINLRLVFLPCSTAPNSFRINQIKIRNGTLSVPLRYSYCTIKKSRFFFAIKPQHICYGIARGSRHHPNKNKTRKKSGRRISQPIDNKTTINHNEITINHHQITIKSPSNHHQSPSNHHQPPSNHNKKTTVKS